jgi:hypothetical protein
MQGGHCFAAFASQKTLSHHKKKVHGHEAKATAETDAP